MVWWKIGSWGERNWRNAARNRDSWQKLLKKVLAQKGAVVVMMMMMILEIYKEVSDTRSWYRYMWRKLWRRSQCQVLALTYTRLASSNNLYMRHNTCVSDHKLSSYCIVASYILHFYIYIYMGIAVAQWLRCCATNRKIAGSIPAGVTGSFMALGSTQPLTEMSTRSISWR